MRWMTHLTKRNGIYLYRRRVPLELRPVIGKREWKISLKTENLAEARRVALEVDADIERQIDAGRKTLKPALRVAAGLPRTVSAADLTDLHKTMFASILEADEEGRWSGVGADPSVGSLQELRAKMGAALATGDLSIVEAQFNDWMMAMGRQVLPIERRKAIYGFLQSSVQALDARLARDRGEVVLTPARPEAAKEPSGLTLRGVRDKWKAEVKPKERTLIEAETVLREWEAAHGAKTPVTAIRKAMVISYKEALQQRVKPSPLAPASIAKRLTFIRTWLGYAEAHDLVPANVASKVTVRTSKVAAQGRLPFAKQDVLAILSSPVYKEGARPKAGGGEAAYWLPVLLYATGCRLEELAQLRVSDVGDEDGVKFLSITDAGEGQSVKTAGSRRRVPVHPAVLALGFAEYVESVSAAGWLFPGLTPSITGVRSGNWSKWAGRWLREEIKITDPRKVAAHSFRHLFKDICRDAGLPQEIHDALTGHAPATVGGRYGQGVSLRRLTEEAGRLPLQEVLRVVPKWSAKGR